MKGNVDRLINIEEKFYTLDHENKIAYMKLSFDRPSDIIDTNAITKTKMLSDNFMDWVKASFDYAPRHYKINLDIEFNNMEGYTDKELRETFLDNTFLEAKKALNATVNKNKIAFGLIALGITFFVAMLLVTNLWKDGGIIKDIIGYIMDIGTTVTFWEALTILIVENKEKRDLSVNLVKKYGKITFSEKKTKKSKK